MEKEKYLIIFYQHRIKSLFTYQDTQDGYEEGRRETWGETVSRYFNFFEGHLEEMTSYKLDKKTKDELEAYFLLVIRHL